MNNCFGIYFLDVGKGDCSIIWPPSSDPVLVDCGSRYVARRFIADNRIRRLSAVVVSHLDRDHIGGLLSLLRELIDDSHGEVGSVYIEYERPKPGKNASLLLNEVTRWGREKKVRIRPPTVEDAPRVVASGPDWSVDIIAPSHLDRLDIAGRGRHEPNVLSAIVRIRCYGRTVLIGADATLPAWERVEPRDMLKADVFRIPHHGGDVSKVAMRWGVDDLYRSVSPDVSVFSVGTNNGDGHPLRDHVAAAGVNGCRRLCTQITRRCHDDPMDLRENALKNLRRTRRPVARPYRHEEVRDEVPCAGSVMVTISPGGEVETYPSAEEWHDDFVRSARHPLCLLP